MIMGEGLGDATTEIVQKKYGDDAKEICQDTLSTVGNVVKLTKIG